MRGDIPYLEIRFSVFNYQQWRENATTLGMREMARSWNQYKIAFVHSLIFEHFTSNNIQMLNVNIHDQNDVFTFEHEFFCNPMLHVESRRCIDNFICPLSLLILGYGAEYDLNNNDEPDLYCYEFIE